MTNEVFINNVSAFLPNDPVSNDEMEPLLGYINNKPSRVRSIVLQQNGIKTRYYVIDRKTGEPSHNNAQLTAEAIYSLNTESFNISTTELLSCGTSSPDQFLPNHAVMVHAELDIPPCEVVASSGICISGMSALKYAYLSVLAGNSNNAIATGSEVTSTYSLAKHYNEESKVKLADTGKHSELAHSREFLRWMLSDGAGAMLLGNQPCVGRPSLRVEWIDIISYANKAETCMYSGAQKLANGDLIGWREMPDMKMVVDNAIFSVQQDFKLLDKKIVPLTVEEGVASIVDKHCLKHREIDYFLPHFSSEYFRPKLQQGLENINFPIPQEKWFTNLTYKGNTGAASIYIMLEELFNSGKLRNGQRLLCFVPESGRFTTALMLLTVI